MGEYYDNIMFKLWIENRTHEYSGDVSGISGNVSGISGDVDDCSITDKERQNGIDVKDLVG